MAGRGARIAIVALSAIAGGAWAQTPSPPPAPPSGGIAVNLNVTPRRVTFDRTSRSATVYVFNQGSAASTFDVTLVDRVMLPDGQIQTAEHAKSDAKGSGPASRLNSARDLVLATPRRITLGPGKGQTIRLRATVPEAAPDGPGEYRTHLTVTDVPPPDTGLTAEQAAAQKPNELLFRVRSVVAISIPVIIRTAPIDARARIENPRVIQAEQRLQPNAAPTKVPAIAFDIVRAGSSSLFGNLEVRGGPRATESLGLARGVGVYPEIDQRSFQMTLKRTPRPGETLTIVFTDDDGRPGTELARTTVEVR